MLRSTLIWTGFGLLMIVPVWLALQSPLLAWREPVYIMGGAAGVAGFALMLAQPLLAAGLLPAVKGHRTRTLHRWSGGLLTLCVVAHVAGLWVTSPPDVIDVLLFRSPTPFGVWGALALWAIVVAVCLAAVRRRLGWHTRTWQRAHAFAAVVAIGATVLHAVQIEGTMETVSKVALSAAAVVATAIAVKRLRLMSRQAKRPRRV